MNFYKEKIIFTGASGRFGRVFKKKYPLKNILYPSRKELNIENYLSVKKFLQKTKPKIVIHAAAISRPMNAHELWPAKSIRANIVGTSYLALICIEMNIKLIYFSTNYVYSSGSKDTKEDSPVLPINKYALSKMGGECAVQMCKNFLILRIYMSEKPFVHNQAYHDVIANFLYYDEVAKLIPKIISCKGILNMAGKKQTIYSFAKLSKPYVKKISAKKILKKKYKRNLSINIGKLNSLV
jgi:dTDP-4-dehydrorhamnose reductase